MDFSRDTKLDTAVGYKRAFDDRGAPDTNASDKEPTKYNVANGDVALSHKFNRLSMKLTGAVDDYDYRPPLKTPLFRGVNF